jgi:hypothetical protein
MGKYKVKLSEESALGDHEHVADGEYESETPVRNGDDLSAKVATIGVVVVGAALLETALIPGILIGAAAVLAPRYLPKFGERIQPLFNTTIRSAYKLGRKARSAVGEVREQMSDIAAEVEAEEVAAASEPMAAAEPAKA